MMPFINFPLEHVLMRTQYQSRSQDASLLQLLNDSTHRIIEIYGMDGVGKSSMVSQALHQFVDTKPQNLEFIAWINGTDASTISQSLIAIAQKLNIPAANSIEAQTSFLEICEKKDNWIIVLDHLTQPEALQNLGIKFLPLLANRGQLIYTIMGRKMVRTVGLIRASFKIGMMNLVYNLCRWEQLERLGVA